MADNKRQTRRPAEPTPKRMTAPLGSNTFSPSQHIDCHDFDHEQYGQLGKDSLAIPERCKDGHPI